MPIVKHFHSSEKAAGNNGHGCGGAGGSGGSSASDASSSWEAVDERETECERRTSVGRQRLAILLVLPMQRVLRYRCCSPRWPATCRTPTA